MHKPTIRGLLLAVAALAACAVAATPAQARLTPVNTRISFNSTNTTFTLDATLGGTRFACPTAELTLTTNPDGAAASGRVTFSGNTAARTTCTNSGTGESLTWSCPGFISLSDTTATSVNGVNTSLDLVLVGSPVCTIRNNVTGTAFNIDGPQIIRSCLTVRQANPGIAELDCRRIAVTIPAAGRSGTMDFVGRFTANRAITMS